MVARGMSWLEASVSQRSMNKTEGSGPAPLSCAQRTSIPGVVDSTAASDAG